MMGSTRIHSPTNEVEQAITALLPDGHYDLVITHGPWGEYTRHRRHEETSRAVRSLWKTGKIDAAGLWMFAYLDRERTVLPEPASSAHRIDDLSPDTWQEKYKIVTQYYGFEPSSWEARATPRRESFWCFHSREELAGWEDGEKAPR